ncbi:hybrid sensor histidine kinase/response regulator transcription factor [Plebeiibacterium marinum]|uniref:histidine kinase n=1 Tax=Plebeiibacterium marinum TaxID=2992111 RepID=A0AAE3MB38_9BACT|nr:substrate-binding domain-containing protein [Plebeiobacterium marinum]MCW3804551.1 substrate-binding domain-containing protein [Plebeiobacterium marinum]
MHNFKFHTNSIIILILAFLLNSCIEKKTNKIIIGFSQCTSSDLWRQSMNSEMFRTASFHPELELIIKDAKGENWRQIKQIENFIEQKVDLLIISPNQSDPITDIAVSAFEQGIPTIIIDRKINSYKYSAYIGADNYEIGKNVAQYLGTLFNTPKKIIEITGLEGSSPAQERHNGFINGIKPNSQLKLVYSEDGKWNQLNAEEITKNIIDSIDFDVVFAHNDIMALGASNIINKNINKKVFIIGIDALPNLGLDMVDKGIINASFLYPTGGNEAINLALKILQKQPHHKLNLLSSAIVDESNAKVLNLQAAQLTIFQDQIEKQIQNIKNQELKYNNQKTLLNTTVISLILLVISIVALFISYLLKNKKNLELAEKSVAIQKQKDAIEAQNVQIKKMHKQIEDATQAKLTFFTNISHEIRTPLTLIKAPLTNLMQKIPKEYESFKWDLALINNNTDRLLRLINQLLDFRKTETGKLQLAVSENELVPFLKSIYNVFVPLSRQKQINFSLLTDQNDIKLYFDINLFDKVIFNILSNAFKFTDKNGVIKIKINSSHISKVAICITNSGDPIPEEEQKNIFTRFYQQSHHSHMGTGIGLSLSKEFIEMHKGKLTLSSSKETGNTFCIELYKGKDHFEEKDIISNEDQISIDNILPINSTNEHSDFDNSIQSDIKLLIVEDDEGLQEFLVHLLSSRFQTQLASNGQEALEIIEENQPDLILTDIMMPVMDGLQLTQQIKSNENTNHLPIIMLTAKTQIEQKIEGVSLGADAYIEKPFNPDYLIIKIQKIIESRAILKKYFKKNLSLPEFTENENTSLEERFLQKIIAIVDKNYNNSRFGVEQLGEEIGLSRIHLYRKMKNIAGLSPSDYLNKYRLRKAAELIKQHSDSINNISFLTGFNSHAYFSKKFKDEYGFSPSEYEKRNKSSQ